MYNAGKFLPACIESILNQTFRDFELILVDDGSTDGGGKICDLFASKDTRIHVIHQVNQGHTVARNNGVYASTGEWIAFVDHDDILENNMYQALFDVAENNNVDMVICSHYDMNEDGTRKWSLQRPPHIHTGNLEIIDSHKMITDIGWSGYYNNSLFILPWNRITKREIVFETPFRFSREGEDELRANKLYLKKYPVAILHLPYYCFRTNSNSITHRPFNINRLCGLSMLIERNNLFLKNGFTTAADIAASQYVENYISNYFQATNIGHPEWLTPFRKDFYRLFPQAAKCNGRTFMQWLKFHIRVFIFMISPSLYKRMILCRN